MTIIKDYIITPLKLMLCCDIQKDMMKRYFKKDIIFSHCIGIIISYKAKIGKNCLIYHNVTIGKDKFGGLKNPVIGDNCIIYSHSLIAGNTIIKNDSIVCAGTIIINNKIYSGNVIKNEKKWNNI
jgi:serine acetyltransferase